MSLVYQNDGSALAGATTLVLNTAAHSVTVGNTLFMPIQIFWSGGTPALVTAATTTGGASDVWSVVGPNGGALGQNTTGGYFQFLACQPTTAGARTVTITIPNAINTFGAQGVIAEYTGLWVLDTGATGGGVVGSNDSGSTGTSWVSPALTPSAAGALILAQAEGEGVSQSSVPTVAGGFTNFSPVPNNPNPVAYLLGAGSGSQQATWTAGNADTWSAAAAAYKPAATTTPLPTILVPKTPRRRRGTGGLPGETQIIRGTTPAPVIVPLAHVYVSKVMPRQNRHGTPLQLHFGIISPVPAPPVIVSTPRRQPKRGRSFIALPGAPATTPSPWVPGRPSPTKTRLAGAKGRRTWVPLEQQHRPVLPQRPGRRLLPGAPRAHQGAVVPPQVPVPQLAPTVRPGRRIIEALRPGHQVRPVPAQLPAPLIVPTARPGRRPLASLLQGRQRTPVPPQVPVPILVPKRVATGRAAVFRWRTRAAVPVPTQATVVTPALPLRPQPKARLLSAMTRGNRSRSIPPQDVPLLSATKVRTGLLRRAWHPSSVVPPQVPVPVLGL